MLGNQQFDRVRETFADQFQPDGAGFLYRKSSKGAAIRVSAAERDAFVAGFKRKLRYSTWGILAATLLLIGILVALLPDVHSTAGQLSIYAGVFAIVGVFMLAYCSARNEPMRQLERRPITQAAVNREEARRVGLSKISYGQLCFAVVAALALVFRQSGEHDVTRGWGLLWPIFAGLLILGAAFQAIRKWRSERRPLG